MFQNSLLRWLNSCLFSIILFVTPGALLATETFSVMTYNLENLFDTKDDPGVDDSTYLPLSYKKSNQKKHEKSCPRKGRYRESCLNLDWNDSVVQKKMTNLASVILSVNEGKGPDILILSEIENRSILEEFNRKFLKAANYVSVVHEDSDDNRGIDTAILSRFKLGKKQPKLHRIQLPRKMKAKKTRGILQAQLELQNKDLVTVFAVHFPSPRHPNEQRMYLFEQLTELAGKSSGESSAVIAGGDFNVINQYSSIFFRGVAHKNWEVSHVVGCSSCLGTHFYRDNWSFLDVIMAWKLKPASQKRSYKLVEDSITVINANQILGLGQKEKPQSFNVKKGLGSSDHYPVFARFKLAPSS